MNDAHPIFQLLEDDQRFKLDAYQFIRDALAFAHEELHMGVDDPDELDEEPHESHLSGQQLCEAIRVYALQQYGYLAKIVLNSWGIASTGDFGDIVYNLIRINMMRKSEDDRREDFDEVYDFDVAFQQDFQIHTSE